MTSVLVIVAVLFGQPAIRTQLVPTALCDMIGHQSAERLALRAGVGEVHWRCVDVRVSTVPERDA